MQKTRFDIASTKRGGELSNPDTCKRRLANEEQVVGGEANVHGNFSLTMLAVL